MVMAFIVKERSRYTLLLFNYIIWALNVYGYEEKNAWHDVDRSSWENHELSAPSIIVIQNNKFEADDRFK